MTMLNHPKYGEMTHENVPGGYTIFIEGTGND